LPLAFLSLSWTTTKGMPIVRHIRASRGKFVAATLDDRDRLPVDVIAQRGKDERQHEFLGQPFNEHDRACEKELTACGVELGHHTKVLVCWYGLRLERARFLARKAFDEHELVQPRDIEEGRRVRRVDHLIVGH